VSDAIAVKVFVPTGNETEPVYSIAVEEVAGELPSVV
jgi:hypothetical protein